MGWAHYNGTGLITLDRVAIPLVPSSVDAVVQLFAAAIRPTTRVISVSHVTTTSGLRLPVAELARLATAHGLMLVVDGAQAVGALAVNVTALGASALVYCPTPPLSPIPPVYGT